jgi:hypothetical protein
MEDALAEIKKLQDQLEEEKARFRAVAQKIHGLTSRPLLVRAAESFVKGALIAAPIAIGASFAFRGADNGYFATWISSILAGLAISLFMSDPKSVNVKVISALGPILLGGINAIFDLDKLREYLGKLHDMTDDNSAYFSDHWIFVTMLGGLWGLLLYLASPNKSNE